MMSSLQDYYDYMLSYSPIDNIEKKAYPNILVTAGLHDPRVAYWEVSYPYHCMACIITY